MFRVQFYPNSQLQQLLEDDAKACGLSVGAFVNQILEEHYGVAASRSYAGYMPKVLDEVEAFVKTAKAGSEFDLLSASRTFAGISMANGGKPSTIRRDIGKAFAGKVGKHPFVNVAAVVEKDGRIKKSENNATIYVIR